MSEAPRLSICVPSRNRQIYFQHTIRDLLRNPRGDIEIVAADNSDDPAIMNAFMATRADPRLRYLPSTDRCLPMEDNWERVLEAATGDWIVVIGDDDYVDPDLADILAGIALRAPQTEMVGWARLTYKWPGFREFAGNMTLPLTNRVTRYPQQALVDRLFRWEQATHMPANPFTIYHGAVRRDFAQALKARYGGRHFEHPVVDYEFGCKVVNSARHLVYVERSMSVLGTCPESNSAAANNFEKSLENYETLIRETGGGEEMSALMGDFPFRGHLGIAGAIMSVQHWFKTKYRFPVDGWEANFARALALDCRHSESRRAYDLQVELCRRALSGWRRGRFLEHFQPVYIERRNIPAYTGMKDGYLYVDERIGGAETPGRLHDIVKQIIGRPDDLVYALGEPKTTSRNRTAA
jgi:glycosyltransferase involved in cell wall biosynthesis